MDKEEKKNSRIPCCPTTKCRLKKYTANNEFGNYDKALNYLLDNQKKNKQRNKQKSDETKT